MCGVKIAPAYFAALKISRTYHAVFPIKTRGNDREIYRHQASYQRISRSNQLKKGTPLIVGEKSDGTEKWDSWYFCSTSEHTGGWVPQQIIAHLDEEKGVALEDYSATELNVDIGDVLLGAYVLNGWVWCLHPRDNLAGWVPLEHLQPI